jgi:hypothetical protein
MLVISNGCGKCGSTWLASIVMELVDPQPLPTEFQDPRLGAMPTIKRGMLRRFLDEVDYATVNYVTKNTFFYERRLIEQYPNVYVIDIERDHADMLISLLFALAAERMNKATIEEVREAYWRLGPAVIGQVTRHHSVWGPPSARLHRTSYERLKTMPEDAIGEIASFVGVPLSAERLAAVIHATSLKSLTEKWSGFSRRFRKGIVGDHKQYFDDAIISHIREIVASNAGYPRDDAQRQAFALECEQYGDRDGQFPYEAEISRQALSLVPA